MNDHALDDDALEDVYDNPEACCARLYDSFAELWEVWN
jgi:hypothetical protein